jgi:hypothetical protein
VNDRSQWEEVEIPDLRIVEQPLWDAAKAALAAQLAAAEAAPSPVRLHPDAASLYRTQVAELEASLFAPAHRIGVRGAKVKMARNVDPHGGQAMRPFEALLLLRGFVTQAGADEALPAAKGVGHPGGRR